MNPYKEAIVEYAKSSDENMRLTTEVIFALPELYEALVRDFKEEFKTTLTNEGYLVDISEWGNPDCAFSGVKCRRTSWPGEVSVDIFSDKIGGKDHFIGVSGLDSMKHEDRKKILEKLGKSPGMPGTDWLWWKDLDDEYKDWQTKKLLLALYEKHDFINTLLQEINSVSKMFS